MMHLFVKFCNESYSEEIKKYYFRTYSSEVVNKIILTNADGNFNKYSNVQLFQNIVTREDTFGNRINEFISIDSLNVTSSIISPTHCLFI